MVWTKEEVAKEIHDNSELKTLLEIGANTFKSNIRNEKQLELDKYFEINDNCLESLNNVYQEYKKRLKKGTFKC